MSMPMIGRRFKFCPSARLASNPPRQAATPRPPRNVNARFEVIMSCFPPNHSVSRHLKSSNCRTAPLTWQEQSTDGQHGRTDWQSVPLSMSLERQPPLRKDDVAAGKLTKIQ